MTILHYPRFPLSQFHALLHKVDALKALLEAISKIAPPAIADILQSNRIDWVMDRAGYQYHMKDVSVLGEDYHLIEQDLLRAKRLVQKIFSRAESFSEIHQLIAGSEPYSPSREQLIRLQDPLWNTYEV
jgi:hypothetical protein